MLMIVWVIVVCNKPQDISVNIENVLEISYLIF